jgi:hypothetical protein
VALVAGRLRLVDAGRMANRPAPALALREGDRGELERLTRSPSVRAGLAQRARIVLLAAGGAGNTRGRRAGRVALPVAESGW